MIIKRKVIDLGGSKYLGLPRDFDTKSGERMIIAHDKVIGFASLKISKISEEAFNAELQDIMEMLKAVRRVLINDEIVRGDLSDNTTS